MSTSTPTTGSHPNTSVDIMFAQHMKEGKKKERNNSTHVKLFVFSTLSSFSSITAKVATSTITTTKAYY
eukprot:11485497-Ditylum_brightwellii.AAC.1